MKESTVIKVTAIIGLVVLEAVNLFTMRVDSNVLMGIAAIIGGIAGYEFGRRASSST